MEVDCVAEGEYEAPKRHSVSCRGESHCAPPQSRALDCPTNASNEESRLNEVDRITAITRAQTIRDDSSSVVEVQADELGQIQGELKLLRSRDAERQAWQDSVMNRSSATKFDLVSHRRASGGAFDPQLPACDMEDCTDQCSGCSSPSCGCHCRCGGYPCQCRLPHSPCIDCPRVSTLSPYFNVNILGALKLDMLFNRARTISRGTDSCDSNGS